MVDVFNIIFNKIKEYTGETELTPEEELEKKILSLEDVDNIKKVSKKHWKVIIKGKDEARFPKIKQFLSQNPEAALKGYRDILYKGYKLEFKTTDYRGSGGISFENNLTLDNPDFTTIMNEFLQDHYATTIEEVTEVVPLGSLNAKRSIRFDLLENEDPVLVSLPPGVEQGDFKKIGEVLADVKLMVTDKEPIYISAKHGKKVTFINSGILNKGRWKWDYSIQRFMKALGFQEKDIQKAIDGFLLQKEMRTQSLEDFTKTLVQESEINLSLNLDKIKVLIDNAVGQDYFMIHDNHGYWIDKNVRELFSQNLKLNRIQLPSSSRARIDIYLESDGLKQIIINIRPKHRTSATPTYIMIDYVENLENLPKVYKS